MQASPTTSAATNPISKLWEADFSMADMIAQRSNTDDNQYAAYREWPPLPVSVPHPHFPARAWLWAERRGRAKSSKAARAGERALAGVATPISMSVRGARGMNAMAERVSRA